jgi:hypothetical protein
MRLMPRDIKLFAKLNECQWLSTSQIQRVMFEGVSLNAVNKRMRKLINDGYVYAARCSRFEEYYFRLKPKARRVLESEYGIQNAGSEVGRVLPGDIRHFSVINDIRLAFQKAATDGLFNIKVFSTDRELKKMIPYLAIIPDAFVLLDLSDGSRDQSFFVEVDLGTERPGFFGKKIQSYETTVNGPLKLLSPKASLLIFCLTRRHVLTLAEKIIAVSQNINRYYLTSMSDFSRGYDIRGKMFLSLREINKSQNDLVSLFDKVSSCPEHVSYRQDKFILCK